VGCGTGALSEGVVQASSPRAVIGLDASQGYVAHARQRLRAARLQFTVGDAQRLPFPRARFDATVAGLLLNFLPEPPRALAEWARVTRPGGTVAAYVWDYAGEMQLMRHFWDAAAELDPTAPDRDEGRRFPLCRPEPLEALFRAAGLEAVAVRSIDVPTVFRDFDDYWSPFLGGQGPAPAYAVSLSEDGRADLRERLRARLPTAADGTIPLTARAWGARGTVGSA
jgi:SAM-dependent methyltransferase